MKYVLLILVLLSLSAGAQDFSLYEKKEFATKEDKLPFRLLRPLTNDSSQKYPLIIFLHGANQKGYDNEEQLAIGGRFFLRDSIRTNYPAYVLFPQCPPEDLWADFEPIIDSSTGITTRINFPFRKKPTPISIALMELIDSIERVMPIDHNRVYIGGLSQGGMGVLDLIARYPDHFAAGLSICGGGDYTTAKLFAGKVALWLFHGSADDIIPPTFSRNYYKRLQKLNANVRYSEYEGVGHNSWGKAFSEPDLMKWLFSNEKR